MDKSPDNLVSLPIIINKQIYHDAFVSAHKCSDTIRLNFVSAIPISQDESTTCGTQIVLPSSALDQMLDILTQLRQVVNNSANKDTPAQS